MFIEREWWEEWSKIKDLGLVSGKHQWGLGRWELNGQRWWSMEVRINRHVRQKGVYRWTVRGEVCEVWSAGEIQINYLQLTPFIDVMQGEVWYRIQVLCKYVYFSYKVGHDHGSVWRLTCIWIQPKVGGTAGFSIWLSSIRVAAAWLNNVSSWWLLPNIWCLISKLLLHRRYCSLASWIIWPSTPKICENPSGHFYLWVFEWIKQEKKWFFFFC